jgi:uncharacterized protein
MARPGRPRKHDVAADQIRLAIDCSIEDEAICLIAKGDVDILDGDARTPLIHAAFNGKMRIVSWLLINGANINHQDRNGWSALHFAVQEKNFEMVEYLLLHGASVQLRDVYGNTPLWRATFDARGAYDLVRLLLSHKADPNLKNEANRSPLDIAVQIGDDALATILKNG